MDITERQDTGLEPAKLDQIETLRAHGIDPYPSSIPERTHRQEEILQDFEELEGEEVVLHGRIMGIREHGKLVFFDLVDESDRIQVLIRQDEVGLSEYELFRNGFSRGDFASVAGRVMKTRSDEISLDAQKLQILSKSLNTYPLQLDDVQLRTRHRSLDLLANRESIERQKTRSRITQNIREYFLSLGCLEIETPILNTIYNGGIAEPFVSHHDALGERVYLRMTSELYLKKFIIGGFEGVFEIAKHFRNEGMGMMYNPEFTVAEMYKAYTNLDWMMGTVEQMVRGIATEVLESDEIERDDNVINFVLPWQRMTLKESISSVLEEDIVQMSPEEIVSLGKRYGLEGMDSSSILMLLFKTHVEHLLVQPTFITNYPVSHNPLAKINPEDPSTILNFNGYIGGFPIIDSNVEENNPRIQRENLEKQLNIKKEQGRPIYPVDADFLNALEYGMPPLTGLGVGIGRLVMVMTGATNIRDVIPFPTLRSKQNQHNAE